MIMLEQETTVTQLRGDRTRIYTSNPTHLHRLRADSRATEIAGGVDYGFFYVEANLFDPLIGFKRRVNMTAEQRAATGARLSEFRK